MSFWNWRFWVDLIVRILTLFQGQKLDVKSHYWFSWYENLMTIIFWDSFSAIFFAVCTWQTLIQKLAVVIILLHLFVFIFLQNTFSGLWLNSFWNKFSRRKQRANKNAFQKRRFIFVFEKCVFFHWNQGRDRVDWSIYLKAFEVWNVQKRLCRRLLNKHWL